MELKDAILSTLAEIENSTSQKETKEISKSTPKEEKRKNQTLQKKKDQTEETTHINNETFFLRSLRERLLVLFEGFQAPNNKNIEAKIDMTLNFLEYVLVTIDARIEELERR